MCEDMLEPVQKNLTLTKKHLFYLEELAKLRPLNHSSYVRTLLEEEWRRLKMDKRIEDRKRREGSPGG